MKINHFAILLAVSALTLTINGQVSPKEKGLQSINQNVIKGQLEFLSSDWMEGRATGERGSFLAADYIASMLKVSGAAPAGDFQSGPRVRTASPGGIQSAPPRPSQSYFQNFSLIESQPAGTSVLTLAKGGQEYKFRENVDFMISRASMEMSLTAPVVFVGYGIQDKTLGIDDYAGIDVKGKIVLRVTGFPGYNDITSPMYKKLVGDNQRSQYEIQRNKSEIPGKLGAAGVIDLTLNRDAAKSWGVYKFNYNMSPAESGTRTNWSSMRLDGKEISSSPVIITITERVSNLLIKEGGLDIARYEKEAAAGNTKFKPVVLPGISAGLVINVNSQRVRVRNVVAIIEGENMNEFIAVGAHMDHMGTDNGKIWNGADDNASGTVAVMTLARAIAESGVKPKRSIVFCAWTGEEKGLLGSEYFTLYPPAGKIGDYKFYMNFDMIARDAANDTARNMAGITYTKAYPKLEEITKKAVEDYKINLKLNIRSNEAPTGGSDYTAFTANKIPVIAWMAAMHPDYHQPSDEVSLVNWDKMTEIIKLAYLQLWEAANGEIK